MKTITFQLKGEYIVQIKAGTKRKEFKDLRKSDTNRLCQIEEEYSVKDAEALERFTALFRGKNKTVVPVNARSIAYGGGS
jgi:GTP1/Obg family GTP-binding protein